jgi:hypothetical protein
MPDTIRDLHGTRVLVCATEGPPISSERDATDLVGATWGTDVTAVAIPVERLHPDFFQLATRLAGAITQKFTTYGLRLIVVGDVSTWTSDSKALRDYVFESNQRRETWFVRDLAELEHRLARGREPR